MRVTRLRSHRYSVLGASAIHHVAIESRFGVRENPVSCVSGAQLYTMRSRYARYRTNFDIDFVRELISLHPFRVAAGSLLWRTKARAAGPYSLDPSHLSCVMLGTLVGAHVSVPRRKNGQPRAHDGRDWAQHPNRDFINSLAVRGGHRHHLSFHHSGTARICDTWCGR
jgi:hypothetical protein